MDIKFFVVKKFGIYLLEEAEPDINVFDWPSSPWFGSDPVAGQVAADEANAQLQATLPAGSNPHLEFHRARTMKQFGVTEEMIADRKAAP